MSSKILAEATTRVRPYYEDTPLLLDPSRSHCKGVPLWSPSRPTHLPRSRLYFSFTWSGILDGSVRIALARALGHSQVFALRSAGIFLATLLRMRWALATLALRLPMTISTVTDSSDSCQES